MCGGAFGSGAFGATSFGSGSPEGHLEVVQVALNAVTAEFDSPVYAFDPWSTSDALFPSNWALEAYVPYNAKIRFVQYVERISSTQVRIFFDGPLDGPAIYRLIASSQIRSPINIPVVPCVGTLFATYTAPGVPTPISEIYGRFDLSNRRGRLDIASSGDLANETGLSYLRKRIRRRATTAIGSFYHLPSYGFAEPLKQRITPSLLSRMQSRAKVQIAQEPDVADVSVEVTQKGLQPIVIMKIRALTRTGEIIDMTEEIPTDG